MIKGSIVALVTPMFSDGAIDWKSLEKLIDWHIAEGTDALVIAGTTGESSTLTTSERKILIERVISQVERRIPIIVGTGTNDTQSTLEMTEAAKKAGVDACLLVTPYYNKPTPRGLYEHFKCIAESVDIPQILYNVPGRTGVDLTADITGRLAKLETVVGIKEASEDMGRIRELLTLCPDEFAVYSGDDIRGCKALLLGAAGVVTVTGNVAPKLMHEMCLEVFAHEIVASKKINEKLARIHEALFIESNPIPVKWALYRMKKIGDGIRLPLTMLSDQKQESVESALKYTELL